MVAPPTPVDGPALPADPDYADDPPMLIEMAEREIAAVHGLNSVADGFAAMDGRGGLVSPVDAAGQLPGGLEERLRIAQVVGVLDDDEFAFVGHRHLPEGLDDATGKTAGVEAIVPGDRGAPELAGDAPVRKVEADGEFRIAFVDAVAKPHPAADAGGHVKAVRIDALVEVRRIVRRVHEFVFRSHQKIIHRSLPSIRGSFASVGVDEYEHASPLAHLLVL